MYLLVNIKYTKNTKNAEYEVRCKDGIILNLVRMTYDTILHTVLWEKKSYDPTRVIVHLFLHISLGDF